MVAGVLSHPMPLVCSVLWLLAFCRNLITSDWSPAHLTPSTLLRKLSGSKCSKNWTWAQNPLKSPLLSPGNLIASLPAHALSSFI